MSFLDDIVGGIGSVVGSVSGAIGGLFGGGSSMGGNILKTVMTGFALNQVTKSINKTNNPPSTSSNTTTAPPPDTGVKMQIAPAGENKIAVVYGKAIIGGIISDVKMSADNQTMWFVVTICEITGTKISDNIPSAVSFQHIYWENNRIVFQNDGITASYMVDPNGNINRNISDIVKIYCYSNGSGNPVVPQYYTGTSLQAAYSVMPGWTSQHQMGGLAFAIVEVKYNKEKNITGLPNLSFEMKNTMTMPGDCLYDYMTSTRYGAGISPTEIKYE